MLQQSLALFQSPSGNKPEKGAGCHLAVFQPFKFGVNDAAPGILNPGRQDMGHYFRILGLAQEPLFGILSKSEGFTRVIKTTLLLSFGVLWRGLPVCRSRACALTLILASTELALLSAHWDEWILLTVRKPEGIWIAFSTGTILSLCFLTSNQQSLFTSGHLSFDLDQLVSGRYLVAWPPPATVSIIVAEILVTLPIRSLGDKSLKSIHQLQPFKLLARDQETEDTRRIISTANCVPISSLTCVAFGLR